MAESERTASIFERCSVVGKMLSKLHGIPQRYHSRKEESINAANLICIKLKKKKNSIATPVFSSDHTDQSGLPLTTQSVKNLHAMLRRPGFNPWVRKETGFSPWVGKIPWRREWQSTPVFFPGEFHKQWSLVSYSPWNHRELDTTEWLTL